MAAAALSVCSQRLLPIAWADRAVFVSVADQLLAGQRLYVDVADNKDPLFYAAVALQRRFGLMGEGLAEAALVAVSTLAALAIARTLASPVPSRGQARGRGGSGEEQAARCWPGWGLLAAIPLLTTGAFWLPGYTHLPGTSLAMVAVALAVDGRLAAAGVGLGLLLFTKLILAPVALVAVLVVAVAGPGPRPSRAPREPAQRLGRLGLGGGVSAALVLLGLALRGELVGYGHTQLANLRYASAFGSPGGGLRALFADPALAVAMLLLPGALLALAATLAGQRRRQPAIAALLIASLASLGFAILMLARTGLWPHHLQLLAFPQALALVTLAICLPPLGARGGALAGLGLVALAVVLSGTSDLRHYSGSPEATATRVGALVQPSPESQAFHAVLPTGAPYARLGGNTHSLPTGARHDWLVCPAFHQYPFTPPETLTQTLHCVGTAPTVIVDRSFAPLDAPPPWWPPGAGDPALLPRWNTFVARGERLLARRFVCQTLDEIRICRRLTPPDTAPAAPPRWPAPRRAP